MLGIKVEQEQLQILPENAEAVEVFLMVSTQWRSGGMGIIGLDYKVVFDLFDMMGVTERLETLQKIRIIEGYVLKHHGK